ncbi:MAG: hypothetical protein AAGI50_03725 [Pseudomonadota bacterium]
MHYRISVITEDDGRLVEHAFEALMIHFTKDGGLHVIGDSNTRTFPAASWGGVAVVATRDGGAPEGLGAAQS